MYRYAAFLRGIMPTNPNMKNDKLRGVFEGLGFENVASLLSSGNIVFSSTESDVPALEARIQDALQSELGIGGGTLIRSREQLRALVDSDPFEGLEHCRETYLTVTFMKGDLPAPKDALEEIDPTVRVVGYDKKTHAVLWVVDNSKPTPGFMAWLEKKYGKDITTRTFLTVERTLKKLDS